ncbi:MAG: helix-turn-helix transcriptional regulator [Solirubrobacterales bacterium]|nr:helix-turn-helix transcriptional regulator [Solirubrobacterales bacterium]
MADDHCDLLCLDLPKAEAIRRELPAHEALVAHAEAAKALTDPTRLSIAVSLRAGGECCVCDLAWIVGRHEKLVSHHLRLLKTAGAATSRRDGRIVLYALTEAGAGLLDALVPSGAPR